MDQLCVAAVDPRIRPLADAILPTTFVMAESDLENYDLGTPPMLAAVAGVKTILDDFKVRAG